jgi:hypothetical protein
MQGNKESSESAQKQVIYYLEEEDYRGCVWKKLFLKLIIIF